MNKYNEINTQIPTTQLKEYNVQSFEDPVSPFLILSPPVVTAILTFVLIIFLFFFVYLLHKYINLNTMAFSFAYF